MRQDGSAGDGVGRPAARFGKPVGVVLIVGDDGENSEVIEHAVRRLGGIAAQPVVQFARPRTAAVEVCRRVGSASARR